MKRRLKVYFIHSIKMDYKNLLYRDIVSSPVCTMHELMLPQTKTYEAEYYKELIKKADIIIVDASSYSFGIKLELKELKKHEKPILYISVTNEITKKLNKYISEIKLYTEEEPLIKIIEEFIKKYASMSIEEYKNPVIVLGEL